MSFSRLSSTTLITSTELRRSPSGAKVRMSDYGEDEVHDTTRHVVEELEACEHGVGLRWERNISGVFLIESTRVEERLIVISLHLRCLAGCW